MTGINKINAAKKVRQFLSILSILNYIESQAKPVSSIEIREASGLSQSVCYNLLSALAHQNLLKRTTIKRCHYYESTNTLKSHLELYALKSKGNHNE